MIKKLSVKISHLNLIFEAQNFSSINKIRMLKIECGHTTMETEFIFANLISIMTKPNLTKQDATNVIAVWKD